MSIQINIGDHTSSEAPRYVAVPFAHPRHYSVKTTPAFAGLKAELTEQVRAEVRAAALMA